jgi:hypothetical protein
MDGGSLRVKKRGIWVPSGAIDVNHPEVHLGLCRIAAKLALAIYYENQLRPASDGCLINTLWTHCQNTDAVNNVKNLVGVLPAEATLQAGRWKTDDTFFLKYHFEDGNLSSVAIFHEAVALIAQLTEPNLQPQWEKGRFVMAPTPGSGISVVP